MGFEEVLLWEQGQKFGRFCEVSPYFVQASLAGLDGIINQLEKAPAFLERKVLLLKLMLYLL